MCMCAHVCLCVGGMRDAHVCRYIFSHCGCISPSMNTRCRLKQLQSQHGPHLSEVGYLLHVQQSTELAEST